MTISVNIKVGGDTGKQLELIKSTDGVVNSRTILEPDVEYYDSVHNNCTLTLQEIGKNNSYENRNEKD